MTHDTHTGGWLVARHRSTPRAIARRPGRRRPGRRRSPVAAAGPRGILLFLIVRARVARRLRRVARRPSVTASIHPSVPRRTAKKPRVEGPFVEVESTFSPDRMARTDGTPPTDATKSNATNEIERTRRTKSNERTKERARKPRARADAIPRFPSRPPSFARSFVRSRRPEVRANQNHKPIVFEWIMGFGTTKTPGKNHPRFVVRLVFPGLILSSVSNRQTDRVGDVGSGRSTGGRDAAVAVDANETCARAR
jgi:hypothetical protein